MLIDQSKYPRIYDGERHVLPHYEIEDSLRILRLVADHDWEWDFWDCHAWWEEYSEELCAGWLNLPSNDESLWNFIEKREGQIA